MPAKKKPTLNLDTKKKQKKSELQTKITSAKNIKNTEEKLNHILDILGKIAETLDML